MSGWCSVALHLTDHALGNAGITAIDATLVMQKFLRQSVVGTTLYLVAIIHAGLASRRGTRTARSLYIGRTRLQVLQLLLGPSVPPLLASHLP